MLFHSHTILIKLTLKFQLNPKSKKKKKKKKRILKKFEFIYTLVITPLVTQLSKGIHTSIGDVNKLCSKVQ